MVKFLLNHRARLDISNALHAAAAGGENEWERVKIIHFLLKKGMDINKLEFAGDGDFPRQFGNRAYGTPLHYAAAWGWGENVECLIKNGADPNSEAFSYNTGKHRGTALDWHKSNDPENEP